MTALHTDFLLTQTATRAAKWWRIKFGQLFTNYWKELGNKTLNMATDKIKTETWPNKICQVNTNRELIKLQPN